MSCLLDMRAVSSRNASTVQQFTAQDGTSKISFNIVSLGCIRNILKNNKKSFFARSGFKKMAENYHFSVRGFSTNNCQKSSEKNYDDFMKQMRTLEWELIFLH